MINNVGAIVLEPAVVGIKEIVVGGSKILVTELPDRTVYAYTRRNKENIYRRTRCAS